MLELSIVLLQVLFRLLHQQKFPAQLVVLIIKLHLLHLAIVGASRYVRFVVGLFAQLSLLIELWLEHLTIFSLLRLEIIDSKRDEKRY